MEEAALQILLLWLVGIGTVANIFLFFHNFSPVFTGSRLKPIQVILTNLAVANAFILVAAFPTNIMVFAPRKPPTDLRCKIEFFLRLMARSTNMCSTCVLSIYQFVTLVPGNWSRVLLRGRAPKVLSYSCYSCWLFSVLNNIYAPMTVTGPHHAVNDTDNKSKWFCSTSGFSVGTVCLQFTHHAVFISIMVLTSVSMVLLLNRHHQRLHHIHTPSRDHRRHPETMAAHTILMVVLTFVSLYVLDCICIFFHISFVDSHLWLRHVKEVLTACFPTVSPLLLIFRDPKEPCSGLFSC